MGKRENQGQDNNQGWEKEKTKGLAKNKVGNSITSPNNNPGVCIWQLRVCKLHVEKRKIGIGMLSIRKMSNLGIQDINLAVCVE